MVVGDLLGVSTVSVATSITPTSTSLPFEQPQQLDRHVRVDALERHLVDAGSCASAGKISSYWRHSSPSVFFQSMLAWMP